MKYRGHRMRKPDPLLLLALIVGLGVVVTTAAQAAGPGERVVRAEDRHIAGSMLDARKGLAERIAPHWLNSLFERSTLRHLIETRGGVGQPFGAKGPEFTLSLHSAPQWSAEGSGDAGAVSVSDRYPDLYIGLTSRW